MVEDPNPDDATHAPDLSRDLLTGFRPDVLRAACSGELHLSCLGALLRFVDEVRTASQGIASAINLQRAVAVAEDLDQPFPISRASMSAIVDLAGCAARGLASDAERLHQIINEQGKGRTASRPAKAAMGSDDGR